MIKVKCFALIKDFVGNDELLVDPSSLEELRVDALWRYLVSQYPKLDGKGKYLRFSKNLSFVELDSALVDGDEIGIIPPVSGG